MKAISTALSVHYRQDITALSNLWKVTRRDGKVFGFTDCSHDLHYLGVLYQASSGSSPSNIKHSDALNVDNLEIRSVFDAVSITEEDLRAGLWDFAAVEIMQINYADPTMGHRWLHRGSLGKVHSGRGFFTAEMRGMTQPLQQQRGRIFSPSCDANLGDARCTVNLSSMTVTGSVTRVLDAYSFIDTARTESNFAPAQRALTGIVLGAQTTFVCPAHGLTAGMQVSISGVARLSQINGSFGIAGVVDANQFTLPIDSSNWAVWDGVAQVNPAYVGASYVGGGLMTPRTASEYFQGGVLTWLTGANAGIAIEVKNYYPNYLYLAQAMTRPLVAGDTYRLTAGCDKTFLTCQRRFGNVINFQGFPHIPGMDRMVSGA